MSDPFGIAEGFRILLVCCALLSFTTTTFILAWCFDLSWSTVGIIFLGAVIAAFLIDVGRRLG